VSKGVGNGLDGRSQADAPRIARVVVDIPVAQPLDYRLEPGLPADFGPGSLCVVPVGRRREVGIVVALARDSVVPDARLRAVAGPVTGPQLSSSWLELTRFASEYYHYSWGEVALPALPPLLRNIPKAARSKVRKKEAPSVAFGTSETLRAEWNADALGPAPAHLARPALRAEQRDAVEAIAAAKGFAPFLLFGVTGSGKTEVYLQAIERVLGAAAEEAGESGQALLLIPEINLTPQLLERLRARFPRWRVVSLHSAMTPRERAQAWLQAHSGQAQVVLGTRTAVFASLPRLRLVLVDEEHDASFKAHGGPPYSARDLAIKRAQLEGVPVVLGSATPSLETWHHARAGRYRVLELRERLAGALEAGAQPGTPSVAIRTIDLRQEPADQGLAPALRAALEQTLARGEQALVFLNRRGFAPVLRCGACEWLSRCPRCDVFAAYHKVGASLRCHHCGWSAAVPKACPDCGNQDLLGVGQGTQRIEETLRRLWPQARVARIDRDNTQGVRGASRAGEAFEAVHAGDVDILVGTQMITKGHDFQRVTTVGVLNADAQLVAADFRAPERLFAVLMQVAGRAGRAGQASRVLIQTRYPRHPLFLALARQDFGEFAQEQIRERKAARMPPFVHHALLTAAARTMEQALEFLRHCAQLREALEREHKISLFDAVPMPLARLASESRAQLLVESAQRPQLHAFLREWLPLIRAQGARGVLRWAIEVDPQAI
jgi:primosomal protein N' (replication factor Y)